MSAHLPYTSRRSPMNEPLASSSASSLAPENGARPNIGRLSVVIAVTICVVSFAATLLFVDHQRRDVERAAARELATIASIAQEQITLVGELSGADRVARAANLRRVTAQLSNLTARRLALMDANGRLLFPLDGPEAALAASILTAAPRPIPPGGAELMRIHVREGSYEVPYYALSRDVEPAAARGMPLTLMVYDTEHELLRPYREARNGAFAAWLGLILVVVAIAWAFARYFARRQAFEKAMVDSGQLLRMQQAHLIEAQHLAKCGSWESGLTQGTMVASQEYMDLFQVTAETCPRSPEEWAARFLRDPVDAAHARANLLLSQQGLPCDGVCRVTLDDGTRKWIQFKNLPRHDAEGRIAGRYGICRDITEEREALIALADRTAELEKAKDIAGLGSWAWEPQSDRFATCGHMAKMFDCETAAAMPATLREFATRFMTAEDLPHFLAELAARFHSAPFDRERCITTAAGRQKWVRSIGAPAFDEHGRLVAYHGVSLDITTQKNALLELAKRGAELQEAQQIGKIGSWYWDLATDQVRYSEQYLRLYAPAGKLPTTMEAWLSSHCHPEEIAAARANGECIRAGGSIDVHRRVITASGELRWLHVIAHPVRDAQDTIIGCSGVSRDITPEKEKELALIELTRQLSEAQRIARMAHFQWNLASDELVFDACDHLFGPVGKRSFRTMAEWLALHSPASDRVYAEAALRAAADGGFFALPLRVVLASQSCWLEVTAEPSHERASYEPDMDVDTVYRGVFRDVTAQKVAELQLTESAERFRLISENMHDLIALHALDGTLLYCSPSTHTLLGYDADQSLGRQPFRRVHADDRQRVAAALQEHGAHGGARSIALEYRYRHRDGHYVWLETVVVPVRDATGALRHFQSISRDVTQRRLTEARLRASEERFRALTEISSDWFWETDEAHRLSFISLEVTPYSCKKREELLGRTRWQLFPDALSPAEWQDHRRTLDAHRPFQGLVTRTYSAEGTIVSYSSLSGRPVMDADGRFLGYRGTGKDITRIKMAERQLAASEELYRLIAQNMRDVVSLHSRDGRIIFLSPSFASVTGHSVNASIGISPRFLLHPEDARGTVRAFAELMANGSRSATLTYRLRHRQGHYLWLESHVSVVRAADAGVRHVQMVSREITARREAEIAAEKSATALGKANKQLAEEIRQRQQLERDILMTIEMELAQVGLELHDELGQDLTGIALLTKTLERRLREKHPEDAAEAARISELVNRTIRHTRMISHGLSPYIWGMDGLVAALTQLTSDINSLGVVKCEATFRGSIEIHDEMIARSLYRIAQESLNNALKHSRAQNVVVKLAQQPEGGIELSVSDDGIGPAGLEADLDAGSRFHSIRHRCNAIDAELSVKRGRRGGTTVRVVWRIAARKQKVLFLQGSQPQEELH